MAGSPVVEITRIGGRPSALGRCGVLVGGTLFAHANRRAQGHAERALELSLHGRASRLELPPEEARAFVLDDEPELHAAVSVAGDPRHR